MMAGSPLYPQKAHLRLRVNRRGGLLRLCAGLDPGRLGAGAGGGAGHRHADAGDPLPLEPADRPDAQTVKNRAFARKMGGSQMPREKLGSRLGFILLSAGCAIGVGNVWKFPWLVGQYGGGAFVLIYLLFLLILGLPIMTMEFSAGPRQREEPGPVLSGTGKTRVQMAYPRLPLPHRQLPADDVLHRCLRLDAPLLCADGGGAV